MWVSWSSPRYYQPPKGQQTLAFRCFGRKVCQNSDNKQNPEVMAEYSDMAIKFFSPARVKGETLEETWYIEWVQWHPIQLKSIRVRKSFSLNRIKDLKQRKAQARYWQKEVNKRIPAGYPFHELVVAIDDQDKAFEVAIIEAVNIQCRNARPDTLRTYRNTSKQLLDWAKQKKLLKTPVKMFTKAQALRFIDDLQAREVSNRTINNYRDAFRSFWNTMIEREWADTNPWAAIRSLKTQKSVRNRFSQQEMRRLLDWMYDHDRDLLSFVVHMMSGVRKTELLRAKLGDVDYKAGLIAVPAQQSKKREERYNTIITEYIDVMRDRVVGFSASCYLFGTGLLPGEKKSGTNTPYNRNQVAMNACGIKAKGLTLNSWRHTGASIFTERFGLSIAQRQLGHDDPRTTMIYSKPQPYIKEVAQMRLIS